MKNKERRGNCVFVLLVISMNMFVFDTIVSSLLSYVRSELTRGYMQECDELLYSEKHRRVSTFMQTPRELEKVGRQEI